MIGESALVPFGYVLAGTVADWMGVANVMWMCALGVLATSVLLLFIPSVRALPALPTHAGNRDPEGATSAQ